ncbi:MAG: tetratricopeptide repeat protein, partial [Thermoflexibacter sp.]|nr:tetratricopeptide repeat protein [Thermoflexibacter sp.]
MKTLYPFIFLFMWIGGIDNIVVAQEKDKLPPKLQRAFNQFYKAQKLQKVNFVDSANSFYKKALPVFASYKRYYQQIQCLAVLSENYFVAQQYENTTLFADSLLSFVERKKFIKKRTSFKNIALEKTADVLMLKAKINLQKRDFLHTKPLAQTSIANLLALKNKDWKKISSYYVDMSKIYIALGDYDKAIGSLDTTFNLLVQYQSENLKTIYQISQLSAENYIKVAENEKAKEQIKQALSFYDKVFDKEDTIFNENLPSAWSRYLAGQIHDYQGNYDSALNAHRQALQIYLSNSQTNVRNIALVYLNMGIAYQKKGLYYRALEHEQKALQTLSEAKQDLPLLESEIFDHLGVVYALMGDIDQAIYYQEKALQIREDFLPANHPDKAWTALHLGDTYYLRKMYDKSEKYYMDALYICEDVLKPSHPLFASIYNSIGVLAQAQKRGDFASHQFKKALDIYEKILHQPQHPAIAKIYDNLSLLFEQEKKYVEAMEYSLKSLGIYETVLGLKHPALGEGYYHLGIISEQLQKTELAFTYYQKAVNAIVPDFDSKDIYSLPPIKNVLADNLLLGILSNRASLMRKQAGEDISLLSKSLQTYSLCSELLDKMRNGYKAEGSKLFLSQYSIPLYETGIELSLNLYELTKDTKYYAEAFAFSEKSKAGVLRSAIADTKAKRVAGIPDSLITYESKLRSELNLLDEAFFKEQARKELADHDKVVKLRNQIFEQKVKYDKLVDFLENAYPEYYMLKYETYKVDIQQVIDKLLKNKKDKFTLVEYFVGNDNIYVFTASEQAYKIHKMPKNQDFEANLRSFRASIIYKVPETLYEYGTKL